MTDIRHVRKIAEELLAGLDIPALEADEQSRSFLEEQRAALRRALVDSAPPERYKVAVVGSFKVGKSSFVNALCGERVLTPVSSDPETASITVLQYADTPGAAAHMIRRDEWEEMRQVYEANPDDMRAARFRKVRELAAKSEDGARIQELERSLISPQGVVEAFTCEGWDSRSERKAFNDRVKSYVSRNDPLHYFVDHLVIRAPVPILKDGINLIDTPGLDDTDRYRVHLTEEYVKEVDAILFLTRSGSSYSQQDKDFIVKQLRRKTIKHLRLVITKCDETFASALDDAKASDEEPPTFEDHLRRQEKRVRDELDKTLNEILAERDVDEASRAYFLGQFAGIHVDFISSKYHFGEHRPLSGIDRLRDDLNLMLQKSERMAKARRCLIEAVSRVSERTSQVLKTRIGSASEDFSPDRVRRQLETIRRRVFRTMSDSERRVKQEVEAFRLENEKDEEFVAAKIDGILLRCDGVVDGYARHDIAKHWKTRRCGNWGWLDQIQQQVADAVFPHVELILQRQVKRFEDAVGRIRGYITVLQRSLANLEGESQLDVELEPLALSESLLSTVEGFVSQVGQLAKDQRDSMIRHLDLFVSEEVRDRIEQARSQVSDIYGKGTTWKQISEVEDFYSGLKSSLRVSMDGHLRSQVQRFGQILLNHADSIYPAIERGLSLMIDDRLDAIGTNLSELNEAQRSELVQALQRGVRLCEKFRKRVRAVDSPDASEIGQERQRALELANVSG